MTTISLANTHHLVQTHNKEERNVFSTVMRILRIYFLNNFKVYHVSYIIATVIMLYNISLVIIYLITKNLYLFQNRN